MGIPLKTKEFELKSKVGDSLKVRIEKLGAGWDRAKIHLIYRIIRGSDRRLHPPDSVALYAEELEQLIQCINEEFLKKEFPE
ncbi:MAG: hypothetical protein H3Z52_16215 [archaeon]|nr:hypothetical protein [archaeon]